MDCACDGDSLWAPSLLWLLLLLLLELLELGVPDCGGGFLGSTATPPRGGAFGPLPNGEISTPPFVVPREKHELRRFDDSRIDSRSAEPAGMPAPRARRPGLATTVCAAALRGSVGGDGRLLWLIESGFVLLQRSVWAAAAAVGNCGIAVGGTAAGRCGSTSLGLT